MAIKGQFTTLSGVELQEAYANIPRVEVSKQKTADTNKFVAGGYVTIFANQLAYENGKQPVEGRSVTFEVDLANTDNIVEQAYIALKDANIIINSEDVFETQIEEIVEVE